jgi:hypothetical protein
MAVTRREQAHVGDRLPRARGLHSLVALSLPAGRLAVQGVASTLLVKVSTVPQAHDCGPA